MDGIKNLIIVILCLMILPSSSNVIAECNNEISTLSETPVWSENFSDNSSLDDWDIFGYVDLNDTYVDYGDFDIINGTLTATGEYEGRNVAVRDSGVVFGTWSFDIYLPSGQAGHSSVVFCADGDFVEEPRNPDHMGLMIDHELLIMGAPKGFYLYQITTDGANIFEEKESDYIEDAWHHFDIPRYSNGNVYVYLNSSLILRGEMGLDVNKGDTFSYWTAAGGKLDNISVYDTVLFDKYAPTFDNIPLPQQIELGTDYRYDVNATDDTNIIWSIADEVNFKIDNDGIITNIVELDLGVYDISVTVADESGNSKTRDFTLTVVEATDLPIPAEIFMSTLILIPVIRRKLKK